MVADIQFKSLENDQRWTFNFFRHEFCDWYLEAVKVRLYGDVEAEKDAPRAVLLTVLERSLRLLHPFMPFVTEEIWQNLVRGAGSQEQGAGDGYQPEALMVARWPEKAGAEDPEAEAQMGLIMDLVRAIRNARAEYDVRPSRRIAGLFAAEEHAHLLSQQQMTLSSLAKLDGAQLQIAEAIEAPEQAVTLVVGGVTVHLPLAGMADLKAESARLSKELKETVQRIARTESLLANSGFTSKAPAQVVQRERDKLTELQAQQSKLEARLKSLAS